MLPSHSQVAATRTRHATSPPRVSAGSSFRHELQETSLRRLRSPPRNSPSRKPPVSEEPYAGLPGTPTHAFLPTVTCGCPILTHILPPFRRPPPLFTGHRGDNRASSRQPS